MGCTWAGSSATLATRWWDTTSSSAGEAFGVPSFQSVHVSHYLVKYLVCHNLVIYFESHNLVKYLVKIKRE